MKKDKGWEPDYIIIDDPIIRDKVIEFKGPISSLKLAYLRGELDKVNMFCDMCGASTRCMCICDKE